MHLKSSNTPEVFIGKESTKNVKNPKVKISGEIKVPVESFDLPIFGKNIAIIGKRGAGKSELVLDLYKKSEIEFDEVYVFSPAENFNHNYGNTFNVFDVEQCDNVFKKISNDISKSCKRKKILMIMDDVLFSGASFKNSKISDLFKEIMCNGRHYGITLIVTMQFPLGIAPELRSNFDYVFCAHDNAISNVQRLYNHYFGMFKCFDDFRQVFTEITSNYNFLTAVHAKSYKFNDMIKWYQGEIINKNELKSVMTSLNINNIKDDKSYYKNKMMKYISEMERIRNEIDLVITEMNSTVTDMEDHFNVYDADDTDNHTINSANSDNISFEDIDFKSENLI
jgi:hypothetical protein